jgi:putative peptidoglycan lipid II flippase
MLTHTLLGRFSWYSALAGVGIVLGLFREIVVASKFGLGYELDTFVAIRGLYIFFGVQVGNALETVFISRVASYRDSGAVKVGFARCLPSVLIFNVLITAVLLIGTEQFVRTVFKDFTFEQQKLAVRLNWLLIIAIVLSNLTGLVRAGLNVLRVFSPGFIAGSISSICIIISVSALSDRIGVYCLVVGLVAGHILVFLLSSTWLRKETLSVAPMLQSGFRMEPLSLWKATVVVLISEALYQVSTISGNSFASSLEPGTISALFYANTLVAVPMSLFVMPLSTMLFPKMAEAFSKNRYKDGPELIKRYRSILITASVAVIVVVLAASKWIVSVAFVRGKFSNDDAALTANLLSIIIFALPFMSVEKIIRYALYCLSDYRAPVVANSVMLITLLGLASVLVSNFGVYGLAVSIVFSTCIGTIVLMIILERKLNSRWHSYEQQ